MDIKLRKLENWVIEKAKQNVNSQGYLDCLHELTKLIELEWNTFSFEIENEKMKEQHGK